MTKVAVALARSVTSLWNLYLRRYASFSMLGCLMLVSCQHVPVPQRAQALPAGPPSPGTSKGTSETYGPATRLGVLKDAAIKESSGLVASRSTPGLFWTHNDSGDGPFIYGFDSQGSRKGVWRVADASARDWEDIAAGPGPQRNQSYLYIGDIGDNREQRSEIVVYRVPEPTITAADTSSTRSKPRLTESAEAIRLRYPDGKHDAETLMVHPVTGSLFIVTKVAFANPSIYEASGPVSSERPITLKRLGELNIPSLLGGIITGGDISPDGRRVALCDYMQGYEIVLPEGAAFNTIWNQPLRPIGLGQRKQGEAIAYRLDGRALLATSEGSRAPLIQVVRR
ncbi:MAG: hypothetical protein H0U18_14935 [Pyrinomonadaceae bacterium]|nr:hypothetical protein [Pyrinomonadaceae bacterium]